MSINNRKNFATEEDVCSSDSDYKDLKFTLPKIDSS